MLAYATQRSPAARPPSPRALLLVIAGHAALLALVLTARGEIPKIADFTPTMITLIDPPKPPPPPPPRQPAPPIPASRSLVDTPPRIAPTPLDSQPLDRGPPVLDVLPLASNAPVAPLPLDPPRAAVVKTAARFVTPADAVRPPYPESKRQFEQEASLRLSLSIDSSGRVVAVDPVGAADPAFLAAARRHILRHWRYQPATEGGLAIATRLVVTLRFELES